MVLEVEDPARFGEITQDPDFQVIGQEMSSLMNFEPFRQREFWHEVYAWSPKEETVHAQS